MVDYLRDPEAIYARSFAIIAAEAQFGALTGPARRLATRVIHACGMVEIAPELVVSPDFVSQSTLALQRGHPIIVDGEMLRHGISRLPDDLEVVCTLKDPQVRNIATVRQTTRSAAAVDLWKPHLAGALVVIGNAPTALFTLLEKIDAGWPKPAAIVAFPVGFVGAAESKQELSDNPRGIPYITLPGRRGGSAMAAAAVNALLAELQR